MPPLSRLIDDDKWRDYESSAAYTTSASFLAYLLDTRGADPLRRLYPSTSAAFAGQFLAVYGQTLEQAESQWLVFCDAHR